jgi:hypothetical protein
MSQKKWLWHILHILSTFHSLCNIFIVLVCLWHVLAYPLYILHIFLHFDEIWSSYFAYFLHISGIFYTYVHL